MKSLVVISSLFFVCIGGAYAQGQQLFEDTSLATSKSLKNKLGYETQTNLRTRYVTINLYVINNLKVRGQEAKPDSLSNTILNLNLFSDISFLAVRDKLDKSYMGNTVVWRGHIKNMGNGRVTLAINDNIISGHITTDSGDLYEIRYIEKGVHAVVKVNQLAFLPDAVIPVFPNAN